MPKQEKGYLWSGYTEQQQADRNEVQQRVKQLEAERNDKEKLLAMEVDSIHLADPIAHFPQQSLKDYFAEKKIKIDM